MSYKIYPIPQEIFITDNSVDLPNSVKVNTSLTLNEGLEEKLEEVLELKSISLDYNAEFGINLTVDESLKSDEKRFDSYTLEIAEDEINIVAESERALYYALNTLYHIFEQSEDKLELLKIDDFADYAYRGAIEGFYGIPWGNKKRKDVIDFASYFKMNTFAFAPKDDKYHREIWWELYPEEELEEIGDLARYAEKKAVHYYWTISPFGKSDHQVTADNKEESVTNVLNKFEQLYEVGVRSFGVLGDDVGGLAHETVVYLMNKLNDWRKEKGDVSELFFCPEGYTTSEWAFKDGSELNYYDEHFDEDIHIFYTGIQVCSPIDERNIESYKTKATVDGHRRRDPLFWMNWPVNDIDKETHRRLFMGPGEVYAPGVAEITGVLVNPMEQPEASKLSVFATIDYAWNANAFDAFASWEDSFRYVDSVNPGALHEVSKHMSSQENAAYPAAKESEEINSLSTVISDLSIPDNEKLAVAYEKVSAGIASYEENHGNDDLYEEMKPFLASLQDKVDASLAYLEYLREKDEDVLEEALELDKKSREHEITSLSDHQLYANPGALVINRNLAKFKHEAGVEEETTEEGDK